MKMRVEKEVCQKEDEREGRAEQHQDGMGVEKRGYSHFSGRTSVHF